MDVSQSGCPVSFYNCIKDSEMNGTLTIQVSATIHCYMDRAETLDVMPDIEIEEPPDDIREKMHILYKVEALTDATITSEDKEFKVHRAILGLQSTVFKKMFEVDMKEKQSSVVKVSGISPAAMSDR